MKSENKSPAILQIIPQLETGGAEQTTLDIGSSIVAQGWNSFVVSQGGRMVGELEDSGSTHIVLSAASKNPVTIMLNAVRLVALIRQHEISLIHSRSRAPAWSALLAAKFTGIPHVTTYHGAYSQKSWIKGLYNSVMVRSDVTIANSNWTAELIRSRHRNVGDRIQVIHRGTDFSAFDRGRISKARTGELINSWNITGGKRVLLNLARLTGWKGQRTLIEAMPAVLEKASDIILVLAGDDQGRTEYRRELEQRIRELGIVENVRLPGHCADPAAACAAASLVVVASTEPEAFGRAAVEAQALETPVIVTDIGAVAETVLAPPQVDDAHRTGWRIPPDNAEAMAETILAVTALDNDTRSQLSRRARNHVATSFSVENMCDQTLGIYRRLLELA